MKKWLLAWAFDGRWVMSGVVCVIMLLAAAQATSQSYFTAEKTYGLKLGTTKPLHAYYAIPPTDPQKIKDWKRNKPRVIPNFVGRRPLDRQNPNAKPQGADPLWLSGDNRMELHSVLPIVNFEGFNENSSGAIPPDVNGDVGLQYYVQIVNATSFRVYNKAGQAVSLAISANTIWNQVGQQSMGDPILLYDQVVDRWLLTEFAPVNRRRVLLAVSENGDPRGSWTAYTFQTPQFPDFPKYGIWPDAYYLTTNEGGFNFPIYAFNRDEMLAGEDTVHMQRLTAPKINGVFFEVAQPVDWDGLTPPPAGSPGLAVKLNDDAWGTTTEDVIQLYKITIDWDTTSKSNIEVINFPSASFDTDGCQLQTTGGFSCIPQPNGQGMDGAEWIITNKAMYRNFETHEAFVMAFMVDVTGDDVAGIRWIEFRKTQDTDWYIYQEGTIGSDDGIHRFMPSIGIDGQGTIAIGYAVSGYTKFPSLRYTGRYSFDPPGMMSFREHEFITGAGDQGQDRFGDYFAMSVDPADDATFWFTGQYIIGNSNWNSRIVSFNASRDSLDISPIAILSPLSSAELGSDEALSVAIRNMGLQSVSDFTVSFQFTDGNWIAEPALIDSLLPDSIYVHIFDSTLHFDAYGQIHILVVTDFPEDQNKLNDTLDAIISKYPHRDVAIEYLPAEPEITICGDQSQATVLLRNLGGDTLHTVLLELRINGENPVVYAWNGDLTLGEEDIFTFLINGLQDGDNSITVTVLSINYDLDENPINNDLAWNINANTAGAFLTLRFMTDNFPAENRWKLFDDDGNVIASDGPFALTLHEYMSTFCIDPDACYTFTVYDAAGDGMKHGLPPGNFVEITNIEGHVLAALDDPDFDDDISTSFCISGECMLNATAAVSHVTAPGASDGVVIIEAANSLGTVMYSIDGGVQFTTENVFSALATGSYVVILVDDAGCQDTVVVEVKICQLQIMLNGLPASPGDIGEIHVEVSGAAGPVTYSLNGGSFIQDSFFTMLEPGVYFVTVKDSLGCERTDTILISTVATTVLTNDYFVRISPNPGTISFHIEARLPVNSLLVPYSIWSASGDRIQRGSVVRYDDTYRDQFYMVNYPPGTYFVIFSLPARKIVDRFVKL